MKINAFFEHRLRAPLYNHVWSWGAIDTTTNRVFLRTNQDHIYDDNGEWALIYNPNWNRSNGHAERLRHIDAMVMRLLSPSAIQEKFQVLMMIHCYVLARFLKKTG